MKLIRLIREVSCNSHECCSEAYDWLTGFEIQFRSSSVNFGCQMNYIQKQLKNGIQMKIGNFRIAFSYFRHVGWTTRIWSRDKIFLNIWGARHVLIFSKDSLLCMREHAPLLDLKHPLHSNSTSIYSYCEFPFLTFSYLDHNSLKLHTYILKELVILM